MPPLGNATKSSYPTWYIRHPPPVDFCNGACSSQKVALNNILRPARFPLSPPRILSPGNVVTLPDDTSRLMSTGYVRHQRKKTQCGKKKRGGVRESTRYYRSSVPPPPRSGSPVHGLLLYAHGRDEKRPQGPFLGCLHDHRYNEGGQLRPAN